MIKPHFVNIVAIVFFLAFILSCNSKDVYAAKIKTLDSLSGALNATLKDINRSDTIFLQKAILRFNQYKQFIEQNIKDTVSKTEGDFILQFYDSGNQLKKIDINLKSIKARTELINSQLEKLKTDTKKQLLPEEKITEFTTIETLETNNLIENAHVQQKLFYSNVEEFKISLKGVEDLIKIRNNGLLPSVVKDTISL